MRRFWTRVRTVKGGREGGREERLHWNVVLFFGFDRTEKAKEGGREG